MDLASSYIIRSRSRVIEILDGTKIERTRGDNDRERRTDITVFFVIFAIFFSAYATVTLHRTKVHGLHQMYEQDRRERNISR